MRGVANPELGSLGEEPIVSPSSGSSLNEGGADCVSFALPESWVGLNPADELKLWFFQGGQRSLLLLIGMVQSHGQEGRCRVICESDPIKKQYKCCGTRNMPHEHQCGDSD